MEEHRSGKGRDYKGTQRKLWAVIRMFTMVITVMVSRVYAYVKLTKLYT